MSQPTLRSQVWLLHGLTGNTPGTLTLKNERLSFTGDDDKIIFDTASGEVSEVKFPWHNFGGGCEFKIGADKYRVSFIQPGNTAGGETASIGDARALGKRWKAALLP